MTSRADVSLRTWPWAFVVFTSPSVSITNIPSGFLLFPHFTFFSGLHSGCVTVPAMWTQNKDLSSPVRVALMHTIACHRHSDSLVLLGCSAPVSSLTHCSSTAGLWARTSEQVVYDPHSCHQILKRTCSSTHLPPHVNNVEKGSIFFFALNNVISGKLRMWEKDSDCCRCRSKLHNHPDSHCNL